MGGLELCCLVATNLFAACPFPLSLDRHSHADALRRRWRSVGECPPELLISDPYGQVAFEAKATRDGEAIATPMVCSWRLRPGFFVQDDLMSDGTGPITITFTAMSLSPYEVITEGLKPWARCLLPLAPSDSTRSLVLYVERLSRSGRLTRTRWPSNMRSTWCEASAKPKLQPPLCPQLLRPR